MATVLSPSYRNRMEKEINWEEIAAGLNIPGARWEINSEISSCSFANRDPARSRVFAKCLVCDLKLSYREVRGCLVLVFSKLVGINSGVEPQQRCSAMHEHALIMLFQSKVKTLCL